MNELTNTKSIGIRRYLLTNVSIVALIGVAAAPAIAASGDDRPTVWIEIGGQLERVDTKQSIFSPDFFEISDPAVLASMIGAQRPSRYSTGFEGKISFAPRGSDWIVSAALRHDQVGNARHLHYEGPPPPPFLEHLTNSAGTIITPTWGTLGDGQAKLSDSETVADFQVGKDVGLGLFGGHISAVVGAGVRYAQFSSRSNATLHAIPVAGYDPPVPITILKYHGTVRHPYRRYYTAVSHRTSSTHAVGPAVSWDGSVPVVGHDERMTVAFDFGLNGAILFGKQRVHEQRTTDSSYLHYNGNGNVPVHPHYTASGGSDRSRTIIVPNVGGFAGFSLRFPNAKVSLGYRGDFFFNANDVGFDARDASNRNFYGPYATISIGLGG